jgi:hypothetical protein
MKSQTSSQAPMYGRYAVIPYEQKVALRKSKYEGIVDLTLTTGRRIHINPIFDNDREVRTVHTAKGDFASYIRKEAKDDSRVRLFVKTGSNGGTFLEPNINEVKITQSEPIVPAAGLIRNVIIKTDKGMKLYQGRSCVIDINSQYWGMMDDHSAFKRFEDTIQLWYNETEDSYIQVTATDVWLFKTP